MSTSYNAGVIIGVKLESIGFNAELKTTSFEVHDKKGNPTGVFEDEKNWEITFKGNTTSTSGMNIWNDLFDDIIEPVGRLSIYDFRVKNDNADNVIIGNRVVTNDYYSGNTLSEFDPTEKIQIVKDEILKQYGVEVDPKLYFYFEIS
jgi:hypothetical protein